MSIEKLVVSEVRTANIDVKNIDEATNIRLIKDIFDQTRMDICPLAFAVTVVEKLMYENCSTIDDIKVMKDVYPIVVKRFGKSLNTTATNIERLARRCWDKMVANSTVLLYLGRHITQRPTAKQLLCYLAVFSHTGCTYFSENNLGNDAIKRNKAERRKMNLSKIHHIAIIVSDYEVAKDFYVNKLGFSVIRENYRPERKDWKLDLRINEYTELEIFAEENPPKRVNRPEACGLRHLAFCVESVEQTVRELEEVGIECEPVRVDDYTGKKMTFFHDPDGLPLELHE